MTHARRLLRDLVKGETSVPSLESPAQVEQAFRYLMDKRPQLVAGPPSVLFHFARHLGERGVTEPLAPFARVGGEQCFEFQRKEIEARLCSTVIDSYGCNETGAIAGECPAGSLHVYAGHVHLEIFNDDQPVGRGQMGEIVVTALRNTAMPLVRYPVGDRGMLSGEPCRCGLPYPVLGKVQSRSADMFQANDGSVRHASELSRRVGNLFGDSCMEGIRQFRIVQQAGAAWEVLLEAPAAYLEPHAGQVARERLEQRIGGILREFCGDDSRVKVRFTTSIPRERGKLKYFVRG
jgi:phenylacetate-CoA ligase